MPESERSRQNRGVDSAVFQELLSPQGQELLQFVSASELSDLALGSQLRQAYPAALVAGAMTTRDLRIKARAKFGEHASSMYFTPEALEQATRLEVARYRGAKARSLGIKKIVDLGCSIGSDMIGFALGGIEVRGVERDPLRAQMARANLAAFKIAGSVQLGDLMDEHIGQDETVFLDPARRRAGSRVFSLTNMEPDWSFVSAQLKRGAIVKTMPGISHDILEYETEWISDHGDLVEACIFGGRDPLRIATVLPERQHLSSQAEASSEIGDVGAYLLEPDPAIIRAGLVQELAAQVSAWRIDEHIAYLSSNHLPESAFLTAYRVKEALPFQIKALTRELRSRDIGTLTIKKRGVDIVPEKVIAGMKLRGSLTATVIMTRVRGSGEAFLVGGPLRS